MQDSEEAAEQDTPQLRIAWQYRRYIQRQQVQQQSGLPSLQEDAVMPGIPSLQSGSLGRLTSAPARSKTPCNCKCNDSTTMGSSQLYIHGVTVQWKMWAFLHLFLAQFVLHITDAR